MIHTFHKTKHPLHMMLHEKSVEHDVPKIVRARKKRIVRTMSTRKRTTAGGRKKIVSAT